MPFTSRPNLQVNTGSLLHIGALQLWGGLDTGVPAQGRCAGLGSKETNKNNSSPPVCSLTIAEEMLALALHSHPQSPSLALGIAAKLFRRNLRRERAPASAFMTKLARKAAHDLRLSHPGMGGRKPDRYGSAAPVIEGSPPIFDAWHRPSACP